MNIIVNGNSKELSQSLQLDELIRQACNDSPVVAEVNGQIIRKPDWNNITLADGDRIELIAFVGGG